VFCAPEAAAAIKSYSPELIVHGLRAHGATDLLESRLSSLHALAIGPGLGRDRFMQDIAAHVIQTSELPLVLDGDALYWLAQGSNYESIVGRTKTVLTSNKVEYDRLARAMGIAEDAPFKEFLNRLNGVTVIRKGNVDEIGNSLASEILKCKEEASARRCGGQGDVLVGATVVFMAWAQ